MSSLDTNAVVELLETGPFRVETGRKQLTLALAGVYIASTTDVARPLLVWEKEKAHVRYYIPIESLHNNIKSQLVEAGSQTDSKANGSTAGSSATLKVIDTLSSKDASSAAVIERLTFGSKTVTWVRFSRGQFKDFIRFERSEIDDWFENGVIFEGVKNPYKRIDTVAASKHIVVKIDGEEVAETQVAVLLNETGLPETYYIPATSVRNWGAIEKSSLKTACPYKGEASYFSINVKGKKYENIIWYYLYPTHESAGIQGLISFWRKEGVEIYVDGQRL